jgi:leucyl/phenylalanyl-tRNA--protein transferase
LAWSIAFVRSWSKPTTNWLPHFNGSHPRGSSQDHRRINARNFATGEENGRIVWHCPDPRAIIKTEEVQVSKRLRRYLRNERFEIRFNNDFQSVLQNCANRDKTWINGDIISNFAELHRMRFAHRVTAYREGRLVGGGYGITLANGFFLKSMFCTKNHASKAAFVRLAEN